MNYYKQGDAAKADKIKAAFEEKGYKTVDTAFNDKDLYYATFHGDVYIIATDCLCYEFFKRLVELGDYKELELPVQPKFKVGDSLQSGSDFTKILSINLEEGRYYCDNRIISFENQDLWHLVPKPHYDIANFQPFDKVLVRCSNDEEWMIEFYCKYDTLVHTSPHRDYPFMGIGDSYSQCIPFEGNEHLLGTTDMPSEEYINW